MAISTDILRTWRSPRAVMRERLAAGVREDRALAVLMGACVLIFVAQWPRLARAAYLDPSIPLDARIGGALLACLFLLPLICYGLAAISHVIARALGGRGTGFRARMALFWSLLAVTPLMLFNGLVAGFVGRGPAETAVGIIVICMFAFIWGNAISVAERPDEEG